MGYNLQAFIGSDSDLKQIQQTFPLSKIINLDQGISMIPLTEELFYEINGLREPEWILPDENVIEIIETKLLKTIGSSKLAYVEAGYFSGEGGQIGIVWQNGARIKEFNYGENKINEVLQEFGVKPIGKTDEFAAIGLDAYRNTKDW